MQICLSPGRETENLFGVALTSAQVVDFPEQVTIDGRPDTL